MRTGFFKSPATSCRHDPFGSKHRQDCEYGDAGALQEIQVLTRPRPRENTGPRANDSLDRVLPQQGEERSGRGEADRGEVSRRGSANDGGVAGTPRRRTQDGERRVGGRVWQGGGRRRGYPRPAVVAEARLHHRRKAGKDRTRPDEVVSPRAMDPPRALADSPWARDLRGSETEVHAMPD